MFDYAKIAAYMPKHESRPSKPTQRLTPPAQPPTNIKKQMKKTSDELQRKKNVTI